MCKINLIFQKILINYRFTTKMHTMRKKEQGLFSINIKLSEISYILFLRAI